MRAAESVTASKEDGADWDGGWVIPRQSAAMAAGEGSHLERYARVFGCVEINTSFHRAHRPATWARWAEAVAEAVPEASGFR